MKRMPTLFVGHGSPMMALEHTETTSTFQAIGKNIINNYGKPKAILAISAHWYTDGTYIQSAENPKQIYDMYGFPQELYEVVYPAKGDSSLTKDVQQVLGEKLQSLRDEGYLIMGSGNIVHNLRRLEWENPSGSPATIEFDQYITNAVLKNDVNTVINYSEHPQASYAVPTPDHYLPLIYIMGASKGLQPTVFNQTYNSGSLSMTGFIFEDPE